MKVNVLIAHAKDEEHLAEQLAIPIRAAGYQVSHEGTLLVGDSIVGQSTRLLRSGGPLVVCGSTASMGTRWTRKLAEAARAIPGVRIFVVQMDEDADVEAISLDEVVADYWRNPVPAEEQLVRSLQEFYPLSKGKIAILRDYDLETRYREFALKSCDIIDLANLPEDDRHLASRELELRRLYVALRMHIEVVSNDKAEEDDLERFERHRYYSDFDGDVNVREVVSLGERLAAVKRVVILGDPGAGKSTILRWLATAYLLKAQAAFDWQDIPDVDSLPDESWLPILIRCRDLPASAITLDDMLLHSLRKNEVPEAECKALTSLLRSKLDAGEAILLVDGLDEITDPSARAGFAEQLTRIHRAIPKAPVVITSRIVGYREMGYRIRYGFEHLTVADLSRSDKDEFARRWCALTERVGSAEAADSLISDIHSSDRIERLTGNPMLLTTMALIKRKIGRLPQRRVDLYEKAVEVLLNWRSAIDAALDPREALPQLEYIAYAMCDEGVQRIREDQVIDLLRCVREEFPHIHPLREHSPEEFLVLLERRTGLLMQSGFVKHNGLTVPVYEFRHLTLQEYLAGIAIVQGHYRGRGRASNQVDIIRPLAGKVSEVKDAADDVLVDGAEDFKNWREPLRLCIAASNDDEVDDSILAILRALPGEGRQPIRARAVLAALCLADEPNVSDDVVEEIFLTYVDVITGDHSTGDLIGLLTDTALSVARSRWGTEFSEALLDGFFASKESYRYGCGGMYSLVQEELLLDVKGEKIHEFFERLKSMSTFTEREVVRHALHIAEIAFSQSLHIPRVRALASSFISRFSTDRAVNFAISWALGWMRSNSKWRPSEKNVDSIVAVLKTTHCEGETAFWLARVLNGVGGHKAASALEGYVSTCSLKVNKAILPALGSMAGDKYIDLFKLHYQNEEGGLWSAAVEALSYCCEEKLDRYFVYELSRYHGAQHLGMDKLIKAVARRKKMSLSAVIERYARISELYELPLKFLSTIR